MNENLKQEIEDAIKKARQSVMVRSAGLMHRLVSVIIEVPE
jgi:hypothetical protein